MNPSILEIAQRHKAEEIKVEKQVVTDACHALWREGEWEVYAVDDGGEDLAPVSSPHWTSSPKDS